MVKIGGVGDGGDAENDVSWEFDVSVNEIEDVCENERDKSWH